MVSILLFKTKFAITDASPDLSPTAKIQILVGHSWAMSADLEDRVRCG